MADRILLVEPDDRLRGQLARFFSMQEFLVEATGSVGAALAALTGMPPDLALVNTPLDEDAATVAFAVRRQAPEAALVLMGDPEALADLRLEVGAEVRPEECLEKPFRSKELVERVRACIAARRATRARVASHKEAAAGLDDDVGALESALAALGAGIVFEHPTSAPAGAVPPEPSSPPAPLPGAGLLGPPTSGPPPAASPPADEPEGGSLAGELFSPAATLSAYEVPVITEPARLVERFALRPLPRGGPNDPQGIYGEVTLPELIFRCFSDLLSGRLVLQRGEERRTILLRGGRPAMVEGGSIRLGEVLTTLGVSTQQIEAALARPGLRLGEALIEAGAVDRARLRHAVREQMKLQIVECFRWTRAEYGISYERDSYKGERNVELNPLVLIFEGINSGFPIAPLVARYDAAMRRYISVTPRLNDYRTMLRDHGTELEVAQLCDGSRTLGEVIAQSSFGLVDTLRIIRALEAMSGLELGEERPLPRIERGNTSIPPAVQPRLSGAFRQPMFRQAGQGTDGSRRERESRPPERTSGLRSRHVTQSSAPAASLPPRRERTSQQPRRGAAVRRTPSSRPVSAAPVPLGEGDRGTVRPPASTARRRVTPSTRPSAAPPEPATPRRMSRGPAEVRRTTTGPVASTERLARTTGERPRFRKATRSSSDSLQAAKLAPSPAEVLRELVTRVESAGDHYGMLGLSVMASAHQVRQASSSILRWLHVERVIELDASLLDRAKTAAMKVGEAGDILVDARRRLAYDALTLEAPADVTQIDVVQAEINFSKGETCLEHGMFDKAFSFFTAAAVQDPHQGAFKIYRDWASFRASGDRRLQTQLAEDSRKGLKAAPTRDDACFLVGEMYRLLGNRDVACRIYNQALDINSGNRKAREALIEVERGAQEERTGERSEGLFGKLFTRR